MSDIVTTVPDKDGNFFTRKNHDLYLKLGKETRERKLGEIFGNTFYVKRNKVRHWYRAADGYGFNYEVVANAKLFSKIRLQDETGVYEITNQDLLDNHNGFIHHKDQGFERQIFIHTDNMNKIR